MEWFPKEIVTASANARDPMLSYIEAGEEHDRKKHGAWISFDAPAHLEAVDRWKADVEQHDVRLARRDRRQRFLAGRDPLNLKGIVLEHSNEPPCDCVVVVDNQHAAEDGPLRMIRRRRRKGLLDRWHTPVMALRAT
jgi:hypothetical protein